MDADQRIGSHSGSLPHNRETLAVADMLMEAYKNEKYVGLAITDTEQHMRFLVQMAHRFTAFDTPNRVNFHRGSVEMLLGGKVLFRSANYPEMLHGLSPTEIKLFGRIGELFYWLNSFGVDVIGVA